MFGDPDDIIDDPESGGRPPWIKEVEEKVAGPDDVEDRNA